MNINIQYRPISIPKATIDKIREIDITGIDGVIGLYCFYYYTAVWQNTYQPYCTTRYTAKALKISEAKVRKNKKVLSQIGLIEDVSTRNNKGKITGNYIKVRYYQKGRTTGKAGLQERPKSGNQTINTYSTNKRNTSRDNTVVTQKRVDDQDIFFTSASKYLYKILDKHKKVKKNTNMKEWIRQLKLLHTRDGISKRVIKTTLKWYMSHFGDPYVPIAESGKAFREKFIRILNAIERSGQQEKGTGDIKVETYKKGSTTTHILDYD